MAQVKVYGLRDHLDPIKGRLSDIIHACVVEALQVPPNKRFHRFFPLDASDFFYPPDRTTRYTIIEVSLFTGRSVDAKKHLLRLLFERLRDELDISPQDVEVTMTETPPCNWGIRGVPGDELTLKYRVNV